MHVAARARLVLARRPWLYWLIVAVLAAVIALVVRGRVVDLDEARRSWGDTRRVLVAAAPLEPGEPIVVLTIDLPVALLPVGALEDLPEGAHLRQRVSDGEVLTELDIADRPGPAALADGGTLVVAISDPLSRNVTIGLPVQVAADGIVLAESATVVDLADEIVFVAVGAADAPAVAAAAHQGIASLLYVP
ncbi:MAG: hypothetical protein WCA90_19245 [Ilumatobacteraceae bacterium]|jgi:hypothetical protein